MSKIDFARQKTSYRNLYVFQKAEAIYDFTYHFLQKHISRSDRTYDQMLQAARSGKQNIVEGRSDASISSEMEIKLFGVARGSLHELLNDYEDFMRTRKILLWSRENERLKKLIDICQKHNSTEYFSDFIPKMNDEEYCNLMLTLIHQTISMLDKMIENVKSDFLSKGGIKEEMYRARIAARGSYNSYNSYHSYNSKDKDNKQPKN